MTPADEAVRGPYSMERSENGDGRVVSGPGGTRWFSGRLLANRYASDLNAAHAAGRAEAEGEARRQARKCVAGQSIGGDIQDCGWPDCGCDPHVDRVVSGLAECGRSVVETRKLDELESRCAKLAEVIEELVSRDGHNALDHDTDSEAARCDRCIRLNAARAALAEYRKDGAR